MQVGGGLAQVFRLVVCNIPFMRNESIYAAASIKKRSQPFMLLVSIEISVSEKQQSVKMIACLLQLEWFTIRPQICLQTG